MRFAPWRKQFDYRLPLGSKPANFLPPVCSPGPTGEAGKNAVVSGLLIKKMGGK
jgi:hypothetical protein